MAPPPPNIAGLVLAAGASSRLGEPKQLLTDDTGLPAVTRMARLLRAAGCAPVYVVLGASADRITAALGDEPVRLVHHAGWAAGLGSSIAAGVRALRADALRADALRADALRADDEAHGTRVAGVLVAPCDMPTVDAGHIAALCAAFDGTGRVASAYADDTGHTVRGIPAILPRTDWEWLAALSGDQGARPLFREHTHPVPLHDGAFDLDTPADVQRWRVTHRAEPE